MDDDDDIFSTTSMKSSIPWHQPRRLPERADVTKASVDSRELVEQGTRMGKVAPARYLSLNDVPSSPAPMSDVEQALDMTRQASSAPTTIPFFAPQQAPPEPAPAPMPPPQQPMPPVPQAYGAPVGVPPPPQTMGATMETVQAMGLPMFLVGSNVQALQTLAATPSLLSTFVDANGMYDQQRLISLVQTLSQNMPGGSQPPTPASYGTPSPYAPQAQTYGAPPAPSPYTAPVQTPVTSYGQSSYTPNPPSSGAGRPYRDQSGTAGNLHLGGLGPAASRAEIMALFSPYLRVDEIVMKSGFAFVNSSDPPGAQRAKDALNGTLIGGLPVRISIAQRKNRDNNANNSITSIYGPGQSGIPAAPAPAPMPSYAPPDTSNMARMGQMDFENVRDDRGNKATKNLFVAGYGSGTTEPQLREVFGQQVAVTGCVMKGNFTFVNTADRGSAVHAREALTGTLVNGGPLRINFAKESGRLGTSFDLTYGPNSAKSSSGGGGRSYYGR